MIGDLHCHSVCSDGFNTTAQIADFASRVGLTHIALTDHDTMKGVARFTEEAARFGITVIPGVECTCTDYKRGRSVHMLCYAPKQPELLQEFLNQTLQRRRESKLAMTEKIGKLYPLTYDDVLAASAESASIHETHLIAPLAAMGYTPTVCGDLLKSLIGKNGSCYVPIRYPDVWDVVEMIRKTGGIAVLAHPGQFNSLDLAEELAREGLLDGIECFHPRNDAEVTQKSLTICEKYNILVTGGTDFHGMYSASPHPLGTCTTDETQLRRLLSMIEIASPTT